jgi:hypothetical protein
MLELYPGMKMYVVVAEEWQDHPMLETLRVFTYREAAMKYCLKLEEEHRSWMVTFEERWSHELVGDLQLDSKQV